MSVHRLLVTGSDRQLYQFHVCAAMILNGIKRRHQTVMYTCMDGDQLAAEQWAKSFGVRLERLEADGSYALLVEAAAPGGAPPTWPHRYPFWSDDFDMDLLKVLPEVRRFLGDELAWVKLYTHNIQPRPDQPQRINCPCAWNTSLGLTAYFGFHRNTVKPDSFVTDAPLMECTFEELLRDMWIHQDTVILDGHLFWQFLYFGSDFRALMWHVRGVRTLPADELAATRARCYRHLFRICRRFQRLWLGGELEIPIREGEAL